jgi:hypothetical protein
VKLTAKAAQRLVGEKVIKYGRVLKELALTVHDPPIRGRIFIAYNKDASMKQDLCRLRCSLQGVLVLETNEQTMEILYIHYIRPKTGKQKLQAAGVSRLKLRYRVGGNPFRPECEGPPITRFS